MSHLRRRQYKFCSPVNVEDCVELEWVILFYETQVLNKGSAKVLYQPEDMPLLRKTVGYEDEVGEV